MIVSSANTVSQPAANTSGRNARMASGIRKIAACRHGTTMAAVRE